MHDKLYGISNFIRPILPQTPFEPGVLLDQMHRVVKERKFLLKKIEHDKSVMSALPIRINLNV